MTNFEFRYASHPKDANRYTTSELREHFLIETLFVENQIQLTYSMYDRYIVGGIMPVDRSLKLETIPYLKAENFLDRRELGIINVGGSGKVTVDGVDYFLEKKEKRVLPLSFSLPRPAGSRDERFSLNIPVLDHGYVKLINNMGSDLDVVNSARVSFDKEVDRKSVV